MAMSLNEVISSLWSNMKTYLGNNYLSKTGKAASSTVADKATSDASGNNIVNTYATKLYVDNEISGIVNSAPETLDTLNELASALGDDPNFATTIATQIGTKADNASVVHTTGDETVAGTKTFSSQINGNISGSSTSCTGNSVSATKLATGRTINIQDADGTNTGTAVTFNGTTNGVIKLPATIKATITGNASTATQFSANKSVTLTGDVTGTASSNAGWSVATTLANSGATAGTYGPTADVTGNNNATIVVPQITIDAKGRVTAVTTKTLTCKNNTYTVNDATLTIQKNGTTVKTFTANASSNVTANITVPTKVSELTNDTNYATQKYVSTNYVDLSSNQIIPGNKAFSGALDYLVPLSQSEIPTANTYTNFRFIGKDGLRLFNLQYCSRSYGARDAILYVYDKDGGSHGLQVSTDNYVIPTMRDTVSLGTSGTKWLSVYATNFYGDLVGGLTLNQTSLKMTVKDSNSNTTRTNDVLRANSSNSVYGLNVALGGSGNTIVGAGESYTAQLNELEGNNDENLYLMADTGIYFKTGANTFANAKTLTLSPTAELSGLAKVTSTSFVGTLTGDCYGGSGSFSSISTSARDFQRNIYGNYGTFWRQEEAGNLYLLLTASGDQTGDFTTARPIQVSLSTGICNINGNANSATYATTQAASNNSTKIATPAFVKSQGYVSINSLAGGNRAGSLTHSVGSMILARCASSALGGTKFYTNVAGQQLYPCRTEIYTVSRSPFFWPIVVHDSSDGSVGSGTWRYLGGSNGNFNTDEREIFGMFLRVA